jgi:hypothetical protein
MIEIPCRPGVYSGQPAFYRPALGFKTLLDGVPVAHAYSPSYLGD